MWAENDPGHWLEVNWLPADLSIAQSLVDNS
jgi:hypothetical protein